MKKIVMAASLSAALGFVPAMDMPTKGGMPERKMPMKGECRAAA